MMKEACLLVLLLALASNVNALVGPSRIKGVRSTSPISLYTEPPSYGRSLVVLEAKKKKKRRRKQAPKSDASTVSAAVAEAKPADPIAAATPPTDAVVEKPAPAIAKEEIEVVSTPPPPTVANDDEEPATEEDMSNILEVASFKFEPDDAITKGIQDDETQAVEQAADEVGVPLPDIKQALQRKAIEKEMEKIEDEQEANRVKIKRSDKEAFAKLLEQQPYADADPTFFEEEEYTSISALLGERAQPFLGIPSGPLQVGHFIGSLVIVLMAFVEYPGFPLTNLPSPLRGALQGGLATVYLINIVLAVLSVFAASERGQPIPLWVTKTLSVGGLAYDQLTQLPTLEQIEKAKAVKGKRALKNRKK